MKNEEGGGCGCLFLIIFILGFIFVMKSMQNHHEIEMMKLEKQLNQTEQTE